MIIEYKLIKMLIKKESDYNKSIMMNGGRQKRNKKLKKRGEKIKRDRQ